MKNPYRLLSILFAVAILFSIGERSFVMAKYSNTTDSVQQIGQVQQQVTDLRKEVADQRQEITDARKELGDSRIELNNARKEVTDARADLSTHTR